MLAIKIREYYAGLQRTLHASDLSEADLEAAIHSADAGVDLTDEADVRRAIPAKWSELEDSHFPLFLSFDHLCSLLEVEFGIDRLAAGTMNEVRRRARAMMNLQAGQTDGTAEAAHGTPSRPTGTSVADALLHFVDAETFVSLYWPHFDERLTKNLDPLLCFAEFVGVIQGGTETLDSDEATVSSCQALNELSVLQTCSYCRWLVSLRASSPEQSTMRSLVEERPILLMFATASTTFLSATGRQRVCSLHRTMRRLLYASC